MKRNKNKIKISELKKLGFKKTSIKGLYITENGKGYNYATQRNLSTTKGKITINSKAYNVAKLVLETFCKIKVRNGQINFINGNKNDFHFSNLEYRTSINYYSPQEKDLIKCVRMYFEVPKGLTKNSFLFKYCLNSILNSRNFKFRTQESRDSVLFIEWVSKSITAKSKSVYDLSLERGYSARNGLNAYNKYYNLLVDEILQDFNDGLLQVKPFSKQVRKTSNKQLLNESFKSIDDFRKKFIEN